MAAADFDGKLARADLVITGEGRIDAQTAFGKTALGVARRAAGRRRAVHRGRRRRRRPKGSRRSRPLGAVVVPVVERPQTVEEAMAAGPGPARALRRADRPARFADLGLTAARPSRASSIHANDTGDSLEEDEEAPRPGGVLDDVLEQHQAVGDRSSVSNL